MMAALAAAPAASDQQLEPALAEPAPVEHEMPAQAPAPRGTVARAQFSTAVVEREPVDRLQELSNDQGTVYFFTDLRGFQGQEMVHRWEHAGEVKAEVPVAVAGPRWRAYSIKTLEASWLGRWTVSVVDADGNVVARESFEYVMRPASLASEIPEEPPADEGDAPLPVPASLAP